MKILMVYPTYPDTFWSFKHALRFISKKAAFPPLGLLTVAAMLPETWEKKLIDLNVTALTDTQIQWADMVFISAMMVQKTSAQEIISRCKTFGKTVVAGGPAFTAQAEQYPGVDHFVLNEAEVTLPLFLRDLEQGNLQPVYTSTEKPDMGSTPVPLWSLIRLKDYAVISVQYSRGCPFNCEFCDIIVMYGRTPRTKTPQQLIRELQSLWEAGWKGGVFIVDDNFIGNKKSVKQLLPQLIEWQKQHRYPFNLLTEASVNIADDEELMQMMRDAGFHKIFLGIETPDTESLKECGKTQNVSSNLAKAVRTIHQYGMQVMGGFIVGFDSDTENIFQRQITFIQKTGIVQAMVGLLNAVPHTRLWQRLEAEGRLLGDSSGENTDGSLNYLPRMGEKNLIEGYQKILATIYSPKHYYRRIHTFVRTYRPNIHSRITRCEIFALFRSMWDIGVVSKCRFLYWNLIIKTILLRRKAFPVAVELAILGQHFQQITEKIVGVYPKTEPLNPS
ncbi:MAG: B12-binding domain-containing radical SAM protein [Phycisphaerae bacterium]